MPKSTAMRRAALPLHSASDVSASDVSTPDAVTAPVLAPALQRRLRHVATFKAMRRQITVGVATFSAVAALGMGLPAYATVLEDQQEQQTVTFPDQSLTVVETETAVLAVVRDDYTVVVPPPLQYPIAAGVGITSAYGPRGGRMHEGVDIFPGAGAPIRAMAAGVVIAVNRANYGALGQHVVLQHVIDGQMVTSVYGHMAMGSITVNTGDQVNVGDVIGAVGATGNAQGAHLHFEIRPGGGGPVNPYAWIAARL